jgi:Cu(I)/Ag(I) efflux system membrane fusion protein
MSLVPVYGEDALEEDGTGEGSDNQIKISPSAARLARISTVEVVRRHLSKKIRASATIEYDETRTAQIAARVGGRVEELFADFTGMKIEKGERLASIYSPELISAQREYLLARGTALSSSARRKLALWGITGSQIEYLEEKGEVVENLDIHAPIKGTIIHRDISEGSYVKEGDPLFHIADITSVWAVADIFEDDIGLVKEGMEALVESDAASGEVRKGRIIFIEPYLDRATRSVKIRLGIDNFNEALKPGMYAIVEVLVPLTGSGGAGGEISDDMNSGRGGDGAAMAGDHAHGHHGMEGGAGPGVLTVPKSAVIDTGTRTVAFVEKEEGVYLIRRVKVGTSAEGYYVVLGGLAEGERVVEKGSFLIDSQASLTGRAEEIYGGALGKESGGHEHQH